MCCGICVWSLKINVRFHSWCLSILFIEAKTLTWTRSASTLSSLVSKFAQRIPISVSQVLGLQDAPIPPYLDIWTPDILVGQALHLSIILLNPKDFKILLKKDLLFLSPMYVCLHVCMYTYVQVSSDIRRGFQISWSQSYGWLWVSNVGAQNLTVVPAKTPSSFNP